MKSTIKLDKDTTDTIFTTLKEKSSVRISKLGVFSIKRIKPRKFFHNFSNKEIITQAHNKLHFRPFNKVREKIQDYGL